MSSIHSINIPGAPFRSFSAPLLPQRHSPLPSPAVPKRRRSTPSAGFRHVAPRASGSAVNSVSPQRGNGTYTVADFMTKKQNLRVVKTTTTVDEALETLVTNRISGLPVIDDDWKLVGVVSDYDLLAIDSISGEVTLTKMQLPQVPQHDKVFSQLLDESNESEVKSYGVIANSFYRKELGRKAWHYRKELGRKAWHLGPVCLCNRDSEEKAVRGREADIDEHECLKWLQNKEPNSVVYVCFGSMTTFPDAQLKEIAMGLEACGQPFIWVVRKGSKSEDENKLEWLPEGFEERVEGKGLIIRGWAPQVMILDHEAVGGFVTHCGWNSTLEGVCAGLPMVTWPMYGEQFYNAKFLSDIVKIGVGVGAQTWIGMMGGEPVKMEAIEKAVKRIMVGEEAEEMRKRAMELGQKARRAVEEGGSSFNDFNSLIEDLRSLSH